MVLFQLAVATLLASLTPKALALYEEGCGPLDPLGVPSLERFDASLDFQVSEEESDCDFYMEFKFKHDETQPLPNNPMTQCNPGIVPPELASDGLPYFAFRWYYESVPAYVKAATGVDHISLDWNPCGHPPLGVFNKPHYDMHVYMVSPEFRTCMTCDLAPGAPVCAAPQTPSDDVPQSTPNGIAFFTPATLPNGNLANIPEGFELAITDAVPFMGTHAWNFDTQPNVATWLEPFWIMGPYNGIIADWEPMFPIDNTIGDTDQEFHYNLTYEGQTMTELPSKYGLLYDAESGYTTVYFSGKSLVCGEEFKQLTGKKGAKKSKKSAKKGKRA